MTKVMALQYQHKPNTACTRTRGGLRLARRESAPKSGSPFWFFPPNPPRAGKACRSSNKMNKELVAPCGINCAVCSGYLAYSKGIPKRRGAITHCIGCRPRNKQCAYLKGNCDLISKGEIQYCFECNGFPCQRLLRLDRRYQTNYNYSPVDNLRQIASKGVETFLNEERKRHRCGKCGGTVCIHNGKCYTCEKILSWRL